MTDIQIKSLDYILIYPRKYNCSEMLFGLSFIGAPVTNDRSPCPYSPHPANRRLSSMNSSMRASESAQALHQRTSSIGSNTSEPSLVHYSDLDDSDGDEDEADACFADSNALTKVNIRLLANEKNGSNDAFYNIRCHYITTPAGCVGVKLEVRHGLLLVKKVPRQSPLFDVLHKYDIVLTINEVDMDGLTVNQAEKLLSIGRKRQISVLIYRIHSDERNQLPANSVASGVDLSGSLRVVCEKQDNLSLIL